MNKKVNSSGNNANPKIKANVAGIKNNERIIVNKT